MTEKTLFIIFWNLGLGGIQKRIRDIVIDIARNHPDWNVVVLLRRHTLDTFVHQFPNHRHVSIRYYPFETHAVRIPFGFLLWVMVVWIREKPRTILTFLPPLSIAVLMLRKLLFWLDTRVVVNDGVMLSGYLELRSKQWIKPFVRRAYGNADVIIVPTHACRRDLGNEFSISPEMVRVIPNWSLIIPQIPEKPVYDLIFIGRFEEDKNVLVIPGIIQELVRLFPRFHFLMLGNGELQKTLETDFLRLDIHRNVEIKQFNSDTTGFLRKSRVLLLPSKNEGMPNVVLEAGLCGVPSVISCFPGADEVVMHGKTGIIADSPKHMVNRVAFLLTHENIRKRIGSAMCRTVMKHYAYQRQKEFVRCVLGSETS